MNSAKKAFTAEEKELLVALLKTEKIIEDKRTNKATNNLKTEAWDRIANSYNNHAFVTKRETIQLRRCWEKIKRQTKDGRSQEIRNRMATGGGSPPPPSVDYVPGVEEVVPHLMYEIPTTVDSDTFFENERQARASINILRTFSPPLQEDIQTASDSQTSPPAISGLLPVVEMSEMAGEVAGSEREIPTSPLITTSNTTTMERGRERWLPETTPSTQQLPTAHSGLQNRNSSARARLAPTSSDVMSMRKINILIIREQQEELFVLRRSILTLEKEQAVIIKEQASENLHHCQKINRIKEIMEAEKLEHQRALWKIKLQHASNNNHFN